MKLGSAISLAAALLLIVGCGPKTIQKQEVPQGDAIKAVRLAAEGDALIREGKSHLAMLKYLEASQLNPYHEVIFNKLAMSYCQLGMYSQADTAITRSLGLEPKYAFAYNTRGIVELGKQESSKALISFRKAVDLDPSVGYFYLNLGYTLIQAGRPIEAQAAYKKAIEVDPDLFDSEGLVEFTYRSVEDLAPEKYFELARVYASIGSIEFCLKYLGKALSGGFSDYAKITKGQAFEAFMQEEQFLDFLKIHGIPLDG
jgi:tetratricopeptide (TPR) repeat protein